MKLAIACFFALSVPCWGTNQYIFGSQYGQTAPTSGQSWIGLMPRSDGPGVNQWATSAITGTSYALMPTNGTFGSFCVNLTTAPGTGASWTWTLYKNGSDQNLTVTISGSQTQVCDLVDTTGFVTGDLIGLHLTPSVGTAPVATFASWYLIQTPSISGETILFVSQQVTNAEYLSLAGNSSSIATEAPMATIIPAAGTVTKFAAEFVGAGTSVAETLDQNESPTSLSASLTTTGVYVEETGNLAVAAGDVLDVNETGITANSAVYASIVFVPNVPGQFVIPTWRNVENNNQSTTYFVLTGRSNDDLQPTESLSQQIGGAIQIQGVFVRTTVAPGNAAQYAYTLRDNGANTALNTVLSGTNLTACTTSASVSGCSTGTAVAINNFDLLDTAATPTGSPAISTDNGVAVSYLAYVPQLAFTTEPPSTGNTGTTLSTVMVELQDANGNPITGSTAQVTISSSPSGVAGTLTANAVNGTATFSNLVFNATGTYTLSAAVAGLASASSTSIVVTSGTQTSESITIQTIPANLQFSIDGGSSRTAPQTVSLTQGTHTIAVAATQAGASGIQYVFTGWSDSGAASHTIVVGSSAATYTASFQTQYQLTISASPLAGGTVTPATGTFYNAGAVAPITAAANNGYVFNAWTGAAAAAASPTTTVTMSAPESVTANFQYVGTPEPSAVVPGSGSGFAQTFTFTFTDPAGYSDLAVLDVLINNYLDGISACYLAYVPTGATTGYLYLVADAGGGYAAGSPMLLSSGGLLQNSQCTINTAGSSASASGNTLTLNLAITFTSGFGGNRIFYTAARSNTQNSGWQALGTWNVPAAPATGPAVGGVSPGRSTTMGGTYSFTFTDTNGYSDLGVLDILTNSFLDGISACYLAYVPTGATTGYLYLVDNAGDGGYASGSPMLLSSGGTLQNSQCTINTAASSASASGNTLTLNLAITFSPSFAGNQIFYLAARNNGVGNSGWQPVGSVTVP
jgi:uncharacterized repeat protein (TIGR02543 family)